MVDTSNCGNFAQSNAETNDYFFETVVLKQRFGTQDKELRSAKDGAVSHTGASRRKPWKSLVVLRSSKQLVAPRPDRKFQYAGMRVSPAEEAIRTPRSKGLANWDG